MEKQTKEMKESKTKATTKPVTENVVEKPKTARAPRTKKEQTDSVVEKVSVSSKVILRYGAGSKTTEVALDSDQYKKIEKLFEKSVEKTLNPKPRVPRIKKDSTDA